MGFTQVGKLSQLHAADASEFDLSFVDKLSSARRKGQRKMDDVCLRAIESCAVTAT